MSSVPSRVHPSRAKPKQDKNCAVCSTPFQTGSSRKIYCSPICNSRAADARRSAERRKAVGLDKPFNCIECGEAFMRDTRQRQYCTDKCKDAYNGKARVAKRRIERGMPDSAVCVSCGLTYQPRLTNQTTCGDFRCVDAWTVAKRMKPCLGCGEIGQHSGRTKFPGYCRTCKPVSRTSAVSIAISNQDYPAIHAALKQRSNVDPATVCWVWTKSKTKGGVGTAALEALKCSRTGHSRISSTWPTGYP